jgi:predicted Fe-Mo cluster-binding NifX family protein
VSIRTGEAVVAVIPSHGVNNVAVGKISEKPVLLIDACTVRVDKVSGQQSLVCVDEVAEVATE